MNRKVGVKQCSLKCQMLIKLNRMRAECKGVVSYKYKVQERKSKTSNVAHLGTFIGPAVDLCHNFFGFRYSGEWRRLFYGAQIDHPHAFIIFYITVISFICLLRSSRVWWPSLELEVLLLLLAREPRALGEGELGVGD
jgi:hypothetical protein